MKVDYPQISRCRLFIAGHTSDKKSIAIFVMKGNRFLALSVDLSRFSSSPFHLLKIQWQRWQDKSWKYCVELFWYCQEKCLKVSGWRPRWLCWGCLSASAADGGIICSCCWDEVQQIVWNMGDFLSSWIGGGLRGIIIPWQVQYEWNPWWGKSHVCWNSHFC